MRPSDLDPLFASVSSLKGIGPRLGRALARLTGRDERKGARIIDLLMHVPHGLIDRTRMPLIRDLPREGIVTVRATVGRHVPPPPHNRRVPWRVEVFDDTGMLTLVFFHVWPDHIRKLLPEGEERFISGRIEWFGGRPQIAHPDHVVSAEDFASLPKLEPVYPLTAGISNRLLGKAVRQALDRLPEMPEWLDPEHVRRRGWPGFAEALRRLHAPRAPEDLEPVSPVRERLAYDELLSNQLALALMRRHLRAVAGRALAAPGRLRERILNALPFSLTDSQRQAVEEIIADMARQERMLRLLQGDVGSGKTVVALLAMVTAAETGAQAALMAPSDILARQHYATISPLAEAAGLKAVLLTGRDKGKAREEILETIGSGAADLVIGTHALFQDKVAFRDLALAVVDEQHRFGVHQRLALQAKGRHVDMLVMTATPIPRTLALTLYGDMDVTRLTGKPAGRQPVKTSVMPMERLGEVVEHLRAAVERGARAYWICPLVEESDRTDVASAEERHAMLLQALPGRVGLVHGRMKGEARDAVMADFREGRISILVATTVVEVGVDVPEATIMIIEDAHRFGLAQLHQLRGRVGRGDRRSACLLLYREPLTEVARERLRIMRETEDGFVIAEADLKLRGAGELLGARQSGMPRFRMADLALHGELLATARDDAELVMRKDPDLATGRGQALRRLLHLFERNEAIRLLAAG